MSGGVVPLENGRQSVQQTLSARAGWGQIDEWDM